MPRALTQDEIESFREELCNCATRRFAEEGYAGVTLRGLAAELGCSPMTPYRYFVSKEEIFQAVRLAAARRLTERTAAVLGAHREPMERLRALASEYLRLALEEPHRYRIMFELHQEDPHDPELLAEIHRSWQPLLDNIEAAIDEGHVEGEPVTLAHLFWATLHGAVTLHLAGKLQLGRSLDQLVEPMFDLFLRGSAARPNAEETGT